MSHNRLIAACALILVAFVPVYCQTSTPPDANLFTNYYGTPSIVNWSVCGSTQETEGCYDSGLLGSFVSVGAMLEGNPSVKGNVVTRAIYVVDSGASPITLYVYVKTDTVTSSDDTISVRLYKTVPLSQLVGGSNVTTYMADNSKYIYVGTSVGSNFVLVTKSDFAVSERAPLSTSLTSITSDGYGFVTVTQGDGFAVYDPNGNFVEDGGGSDFMLGTAQGLSASSLLIGESAAPRVHIESKAPSVRSPQ